MSIRVFTQYCVRVHACAKFLDEYALSLMAYELYKRTSVRVDSPTIALIPDGRIAVNAAASRILINAGVKAVVLLWDTVNRKIALKAASRSDGDSYAVSFSPDHHAGTLRAKSFLAHVGWRVPSRVTLPAEWNEKEKMLEVSVPKYLEPGKHVITRRKI